ncbi:hypothetical protein BKD09_07390 [Bradyrhizobium japonicum]|uniref:Uncharacterized protein n=2 Tax=Bradyrhizobium japonicum TaxID=375 RepID=A0A1L3F4C0_BRAJP|nr:hypothetical protein BKD09_07390 [Bradyrhizobium japonicum]
MRASTSVWGGEYNPIIPVFQRPPKEWKPEIYQQFRGAEVAKGYARFFEPDVYVEAQKGLLEEAGLGSLRDDNAMHPAVLTLGDFLRPESDHRSGEPLFGLSMIDVLRHIFKTEQQFVRRDKRDQVLVMPSRTDALAEAIFGVYPAAPSIKYLTQAYIDVYQPDKVKASPEVWRRVYLRGAQTPLRATKHGTEAQRYWYHDLLIYVFNPERATDLIDLWNLRLEPRPVLPVPLQWFSDLADDIYNILKEEHRPVVGNPHGVMHNATIEFGRSIAKTEAERLIHSLRPGLPAGAVVVKYWRNAIWIERRDDSAQGERRLKVTAADKRADLVVQDDGALRTTFEPIAPDFADRYGGESHRWVNVLNVSNFSPRDIATVLPFNTFNRKWPRIASGGEQVSIGMEGWVFPQQFRNLNQYVGLMSANDAIVGALAQLGVKAELSEPGHIARQMLDNLGGLSDVHFLADIQTIELLNKMAGGLRRQNNEDDTIEENFGLRTAPLKAWTDLIAARKAAEPHSLETLEDYTTRNIIRLGLETDCPHCRAKNWNTLSDVDYRITCERCLKLYDFPQANVRSRSRNFTYRVIGPFSVPDYGRGAYGALLTLRLLGRLHSTEHMTYSTAMNLSVDNLKCEVDFLAWRADDRLSDRQKPPTLIIGEAKSLGNGELVKQKDLAKLKAIASRLPNSVVVISVLRDRFTPTEKKLLTAFANWGRRVNVHGEPTNPVLLLTSNELMVRHFLSRTWEKLGGVHAKFKDYKHTRNLLSFADATQQIYLGMKSFSQARNEYWQKRVARRASKE